MEETMRFVCTTTERIVKNTAEFIQNVDWKKVAIGVGATLVVTAVVVATGGAAAPVLIGAAIGAGTSTGITVVSGAIQGKSPAEIAQDASDTFMWGAIGGAVGGGTTSVLQSVGKSAAGSYIKSNLIEGGMDTAVDLAQTASQKGGLTGKDVLTSVALNVGGALISAPDTPSTTRNQIVDGVSDSKAVRNAVSDSTDDALRKSSKTQTIFKGQKVQQSDDLFDPNQVSSWKEKGKVITGTNIERMESGRAPIGYDGKSVNLHHVDQTDTGGLIEISASEHQSRYSELHTNTGQVPSQVNRNKFNSWKKQYWPDRANDFK